jgi:hypothetical protein
MPPPERMSAAWGSAGAMSGPPQMKGVKEVNGSPQVGECGGHVGAPADEGR